MINNNVTSVLKKVGSSIKAEVLELNLNPVTLISKEILKTSLANVKENKSYTITNVCNLKGKRYVVPKNATLKFEGSGKILNAVIVGLNSTIIADTKIFDNVKVEGTWKCPGNVGWWAEGTTDVNNPKNEYSELLNALDSSFTELIFPTMKFYTTLTLVLKVPKKLVLHGSKTRWPLKSGWNTNTALIFTDKNIDLLEININNGEVGKYFKADTVEIIGGNFDVSLCDNYSHSVIKVLADDNQRIWGLTINTNIIGKFVSEQVNTGIGIDLNPVEIHMTDNNKEIIPNTEQYKIRSNVAYITNVEINSDISYMGTGVKAILWGDDKNWLTDMNIGGNIRYCASAIDTNVDGTITASIQAGKYWNNLLNDAALIYIRGGKTSVAIGSAIYDICLGKDNNWANRYAVFVEDSNQNTASKIVPFGKFLASLIGGGMLIDGNWIGDRSLIKGRAYIPIVKESYFLGGNSSEKSNSIVKNYNPYYNELTSTSW